MQTQPHSRPLPTESSNQRILIIDDNTSIHEDIRKILGVQAKEDEALDTEAADLFGSEIEVMQDVAFEIDSAFQGQEGLAMAQRALDEGRPYAMAFVDVRMPPGWDGIETISRIWKFNPELQIVICTAYSDYSWAEMIRQVGKTDNLVILKKPFDNVEVLQLAHTLTRKWALSHRLQCHLEGLDQLVARRTEELQSTNARLRDEMKEREHAQAELRVSEERFSKAFQASPIPMAIQSLETERYLDVNDAFVAVTGFPRFEIISRTSQELRLCTAPHVHADLLEQLRQTKSVRNFELQIQSQTGDVRECVVSAEAFTLGTVLVALVAALDVSEQRRLEKQLRHTQKLEAVGQLAAGIAHDFNNILTVILGHTGLQLTAANLDEDMADSLRQMTQAGERAAALTRQLLAFSRKQMMQPQLLRLDHVVENLRDMLSRVIGEHITLKCEFEENIPPIYADEGNVEQIIMNLVVNARDAMPNGGHLTVGIAATEITPAQISRNPQARAGRYVCLTVADDGCGMSPETLNHMFEPFFTTKEVGKGTGLGLATVHGIVAQQGGWVQVSSTVGEGSAFKAYMPASTGTEGEQKAEETDCAPRGGTETILVVEDEDGVRGIITDTLIRRGYQVLEASNGPEAIDIWAKRNQEIDMLLTDVVMPKGMKGNVLAERLRTDRSNLKVLFSSGYNTDLSGHMGQFTPSTNFLQKPYKPEALARAVRDCLDA